MLANLFRGSIRRSLSLSVSALVVGSLAAFTLAYQLLVVTPYAEREAERDLALTGDLVRARVELLFDKVRQDLLLQRARGRSGAFSLDDLDGFNAWFVPYLVHSAAVSSVLFARDDGRETLLLQLPDGTWMNRVTDPGRRPGMIRRVKRDASARPVQDALERSDYDPRRRPWFGGALALADEEGVHWTEPYTFFTTKEPGITASVRWSDSRGRRYVMAFDVLLSDLTLIARSLNVSPHGFVSVLTCDGTVLVPPRYPGLEEEGLPRPSMVQVEEIDIPPLAGAFVAWRAGGASSPATVRAAFGGADWVARIERYTLPPHEICIATMAPSRDFEPAGRPLALALGATGLLVMALGVAFARVLARRFASPLEQLVAESERIGALDFSDPHAVTSGWREMDRLGDAHERMRELLREATRRLEDANRELEERVARRTLALEAANRELASFSYAVSHDLRAPLRGINGLCTIIEQDYGAGLGPDAQQLFERVRAATRRMGELIDSLLALAQLSNKPLAPEIVDLSAIARETGEDLRRNDPSRSAEFAIAPGLRARGDPALLRDLIENLLGNAWKYTRLSEHATISFDAVERDGAQVYRVADNGVGFDMAHAGKLFEPFQRLHSAEAYPGIGVGLATVRRILARHGGRIWVESAPGRGAAFYFTLDSKGEDARQRAR